MVSNDSSDYIKSIDILNKTFSFCSFEGNEVLFLIEVKSELEVKEISTNNIKNKNMIKELDKEKSKENNHDKHLVFYCFTQKDVYYIKCDYNFLKSKKDGFKYDGPWSAFFKFIESAVSKPKYITLSRGKSDNLEVILHLPLTETLSIKFDLELVSLSKSDTDPAILYRRLFIESFKVLESVKKEVIDLKSQPIIKSDVNFQSNSNFNQDDLKNNKKGIEVKKNKRKFKSDLINPNAKKRNLKGVQFIAEESDSKESI